VAIFIIAAIISAVLLMTRGLKRDYSLEAFVAAQSPEYARFRRLMDEFYDLRGWDRRTGWPTHDTLKQLDMADIADGMAPAGKIPDGDRRDGTTNEHE